MADEEELRQLFLVSAGQDQDSIDTTEAARLLGLLGLPRVRKLFLDV